MGSIVEVVQTVKNPRSSIQSVNNDADKREALGKFNLDTLQPKNAETDSVGTPGRQTPKLDASSRDSVGSRKSARISLLG